METKRKLKKYSTRVEMPEVSTELTTCQEKEKGKESREEVSLAGNEKNIVPIDKVYKDLVDVNKMLEQKLARYEVDGKIRLYIKEKINEKYLLWWQKWEEMLNSDDRKDVSTAMIEFNKLQARILPTQITDEDGNNLSVNIVNYVSSSSLPNGKENDEKKIIEGKYATENNDTV